MKLNGISLGGYRAGGDEVTFSLVDTTIEAVAALDGETLTVTDEDGETVEVFAGYAIASVALVGESVKLRAIRRVEESAAAAIEALEENVRVMRQTVTATQATANEAKATAEKANNPQMATFAALALKPMAATMTDEDAMSVSTLWPEWSGDGVSYAVDDIVRVGDQLYRCEQAHTSQADWEPSAAASLWSAISIAGDGIDVWSQPTGAHNAYNTGDRVHYPDASGPVYESTIDGNIWVPDAYPQGWQLIE